MTYTTGDEQMRFLMVANDDLVICRSPDGWSLHAPGSTDEDIATGDAPYLVNGPDEPSDADYRAAAERLAPWAAEIIEVDSGYMAFESVRDADAWRAQV